MLQLAETATSLTIRYPLWLGPLGAIVGYAIVYFLLRQAKGSKKPIQHMVAGVGGFIIVTFVCLGALMDRTVLDATGARESRIIAGERSATWGDVLDAAIEERRSGRSGMQAHLVLRLASGGELAMTIAGLDAAERVRVLDFAKARAGR